MTATTPEEQHYETLSPDHQLIWRLQARRDTEDEYLYTAGDTLEAWTRRLGVLHDVGFEVRRALDVMMFSLLDPPATTRPGLRRTAWAILLNAEPYASLGEEDAARLEALARTDACPLIDPEDFNDAVIEACIGEESRLAVVLGLPGEQMLTHPAATSIDHLRYTAHRGLTVNGASPDLQAAILRFLDTDVALRTHAAAILRTGQRQVRDNAPLDARYAKAAICVTTVIRLLYLPQLLPGHLDMKINLAMGAMLWRMAKDLWTGPAEWRADLNLLRTHLKALGRVHDNHRMMRPLEHYDPGIETRNANGLIEEALRLHSIQIADAHHEIPDVDQDIFDMRRTPAGRLAERIAYVAYASGVPCVQWGPRMRALSARVQHVPPLDELLPLYQRTGRPEKTLAIIHLTADATRSAVLLAYAQNPGRDVLAACAVGLAQLREATRLGAPLGSMTLEFETALRALWRSLGCPPCTWPTAIHGPTDEEATAWQGQIEALITTAREKPLTPGLSAPSVPAPESYAFVPWQKQPDPQEHNDTENQSDTTFTCNLTPIEKQVLSSLEDKTLVILGGICKPHAKAALIRDLKLKDVDWIESTEDDNGQQAHTRLHDPNVVAVIFALRWAGHAHGSIQDVAWSPGIPAVSLPGGYSSWQVLHQLSS